MNLKHIGKIGLLNNGNTCYLNACLQLLSHSGHFVHHILKEINNNNTNDFNNIEKNISKLLLEKWISKNNTYNPIEIQKTIAKENDLFNPKYNNQNDSSESMIYILDSLKNIQFKKIFENNINSIKTCNKCENISITKEIFTLISLDFTNNIKDSLELFIKPEFIDDVYCEKCDSNQLSEKKYEIKKLSNCLIFHMKRFKLNNNQYIKNNNEIHIEDILNINNILYELRGFIIHNGRMNGGHYFFIGKNLTNEWVVYNDNHCYIKKINLKDYAKNSYIFLYEKINN